MIFLQLFWEFSKIGLFSVGGGLATLPFIYDLADRTAWFSYQQVTNMLAVSESTPGSIGLNMATYVGFTQAGLPGAVTATLGLIVPEIAVILLIATGIRRFRDCRAVSAVFYGLRPASAALIAAACLGVVQSTLLNLPAYAAGGRLCDIFEWKGIALAAVIWVFTNLVKPTKKLHPIVFIAFSAAVGIVFSFAGV